MQIFTRTGHLRDQTLEKHAQDALESFAGVEVQEHLEGCGYCRYQLQEVRRLLYALKVPVTPEAEEAWEAYL